MGSEFNSVNVGLRGHQFVKEGAEEVLDLIAFALLLMVEKFAPVAQVLDEFLIAVDVGVEVAELSEQRALGLGVAQVKLPHPGVEQVVEEEARIRHCGNPALLLRFLAGHNRPSDGPGVGEESGVDGFVFGGSGHGEQVQSRANHELGIR